MFINMLMKLNAYKHAYLWKLFWTWFTPNVLNNLKLFSPVVGWVVNMLIEIIFESHGQSVKQAQKFFRLRPADMNVLSEFVFQQQKDNLNLHISCSKKVF